jgi:colicin import membrane protein
MSDTETTEVPATGPKSQHWKHAAMVEWLQRTKGMPSGADAPTVIAFAFAHRVEWRRSDEYTNLVESHNAGAAERQAAERQAREADKAARAEERAQAKAAKDAEKAAAEAAKAAAPAKEAAPVKATKKATKKAAAAEATDEGTETEDPFGD